MKHDRQVKICYIIPEWREDTATHFYHKYAFTEYLRSRAAIKMLPMNRSFAGALFAVLYFRLRGYRIFYVHYSLRGAVLALAVTRLAGGYVFYWNCGMPWLFTHSWLHERIFRWVLRQSIFVTGTRGLLGTYSKRYGFSKESGRVLPNAISLARFHAFSREDARRRLGIAPDAAVVLFLHRLSPRKGTEALPEIMQRMRAHERILFLVVGSGPEESSLKDHIVGRGLTGVVRFEGAVPHERVPEYFAAADIYLMPAEEEGFPNALWEAMAAGVPYVASDVGGVREMTPPELHSYLLPSLDYAGFVRLLGALLEDKELRARLSHVEQDWVRQYDIPTVAEQFMRMITKT